jgi:hypothetical protein
MMNATPLYPVPFHPAEATKRRDWSDKWPTGAYYSTRTHHPVRYYLIDFGISCQYTPEQCPPWEKIIKGGVKTAPEHLTGEVYCNPFPTDVWYLGDLIKKYFIEVGLCSLQFAGETNIKLSRS